MTNNVLYQKSKTHNNNNKTKHKQNINLKTLSESGIEPGSTGTAV